MTGLVARPAPIAGVHRWQVHTRAPRGVGRYLVDWSPDGSKIAMAGLDGLVRVVDVSSKEVLRVIPGHASCIDGIRWNPDGKSLATTSNTTRSFVFWDIERGVELCRLQVSDIEEFDHVHWRPDGKQLATTSKWGMDIWNWDGRGLTLAAELRLPEWLYPDTETLFWSPTGTKCAVIWQSKVLIWDLADNANQPGTANGDSSKNAIELDIPGEHVGKLAWSPDSSRIATAYQKSIRIWDVAKQEVTLKLEGAINAEQPPMWSPDGRTLAVRSYQDVQTWSSDGITGPVLKGRRHTRAMSFSADSHRLTMFPDGEIWEVSTGKQIRNNSPCQISYDDDLQLSPDSNHLAVATKQGQLAIYRTLDNAESVIFPTNSQLPTNVEWGKSDRIATASQDEVVRIWDENGAVDNTLDFAEQRGNSPRRQYGVSIDWSPTGRHLAICCTPQRIHLWDVAALGAPRIIATGEFDSGRLAWRPDGMTIVRGGNNDRFREWDVNNGQLIREITLGSSFDFPRWPYDSKPSVAIRNQGIILYDPVSKQSRRLFNSRHIILNAKLDPSGQQIAVAIDDFHGLQLINATNGELISDLERGSMRMVDWNHDGSKLAAIPKNGPVSIHSAPFPAQNGLRLHGHDGPVNYFAWEANGNRIATIGNDDTIRCWNSETGAILWVGVHLKNRQSVVFSDTGELLFASPQAKHELLYLVEKSPNEISTLTADEFQTFRAAAESARRQ